MNAELKKLEALVTSHGGTLEQDNGGRYEVWQAVSPKGKIWDEGVHHIRIEWVPGCPDSREAMLRVIKYATERLAWGAREMTEQEKYDSFEGESE